MKLKIATLLLAVTGSSFGALISIDSLQSFDGTGDTGFTYEGGAAVTSGTASVGIFSSLTDAQILDFANARNFIALSAAFTSLASDDFSAGLTSAYGQPIDGLVSASVDNYVASGSNTLYTYVISSSQFGLFKHNSTLVPDAPQPAPATNYLLNFTDGTIIVGSVGASYVADYSNPQIGGSATTTVANSIQLLAVPEPSSALLGALGALGLLRRRRN